MSKSKPPDMLRFLDVHQGAPHEFGWNGPWPPPEKVSLAVGSESGLVKVFERYGANALDPALIEELEAIDSITVTDYRLRNASQLPDDFESAHVFRGAEYEREGA